MDYYSILNVSLDADTRAIQAAYRDLAIKWHPARSEDPEAQAHFDEVTEAFQVLSNYALRALYDKFGEAGLKDGVPDGAGDRLGGNYMYAHDSRETFASFFGSANPFATIVEAATADVTNSGLVLADELPLKQTVFELITLEDVFNGSTKTVQVRGRKMSYQIMPSFTSGSTLVFNEDGSGAGEVLVVLEQEKHPFFERHGSSPDLHYTANISVLDSLVGCSVEVRSLGGEIFKVAVTDIVHPDFTKVIAGGGLPDADGRHGDLVVHFNIQFPTSLRPEQKMLLQVALACPKTLTQEQQSALVGVRNVFHAV